MGVAVSLQRCLTWCEESLSREDVGMWVHEEYGHRKKPQAGASFHACCLLWRSFCEGLSSRREKPSCDAGTRYMRVVILEGVGTDLRGRPGVTRRQSVDRDRSISNSATFIQADVGSSQLGCTVLADATKPPTRFSHDVGQRQPRSVRISAAIGDRSLSLFSVQ